VNLVYIHGANATGDSFNYIRHHLNHPIETVIEYNSYNGFKNNLNRMRETISQSRDSIFFVAHSLGGIYALHLAQHFTSRVVGAVTLSTPYGGCREAVLANFFYLLINLCEISVHVVNRCLVYLKCMYQKIGQI
jgi:predicted alpha/beta hydrolase family esterase